MAVYVYFNRFIELTINSVKILIIWVRGGYCEHGLPVVILTKRRSNPLQGKGSNFITQLY